MKKNYLCPVCKAYLNVNNYVIFSVEVSKNKQKGLILLSSQIGDYDYIKHSLLDFDKGDTIDFFCPVCHAELQSDYNKSLAMVLMSGEDNNEYQIVFSRVAGEKMTYKLTIDDEYFEAFGKDSSKYTNYFGSL